MSNQGIKKSDKVLLTLFLLWTVCMFMYGFYKGLSGFVANKFEEPLTMLPMIISYLLPVFCFLFWFYDYNVKSVGRVGRWVYSGIVVTVALVCLVGIFCNLPLYASNNALGVYETIPSIIVAFPYDAIVFLILLIGLQVVDFHAYKKPQGKTATILKEFKSEGSFSLGRVEYGLYSVMAIFAFVFFGAGLCATSAMENALYDGKFVFLWLWVMFLPMVDVLYLVIKPERRLKKRWQKWLAGGSVLLLNLLFGVLFWVFEVVYPDFVIHVGKPLFVITFSVSLPIEPLVILSMMAITIVICVIKGIRTLVKKEKAVE